MKGLAKALHPLGTDVITKVGPAAFRPGLVSARCPEPVLAHSGESAEPPERVKSNRCDPDWIGQRDPLSSGRLMGSAAVESYLLYDLSNSRRRGRGGTLRDLISRRATARGVATVLMTEMARASLGQPPDGFWRGCARRTLE